MWYFCRYINWIPEWIITNSTASLKDVVLRLCVWILPDLLLQMLGIHQFQHLPLSVPHILDIHAGVATVATRYKKNTHTLIHASIWYEVPEHVWPKQTANIAWLRVKSAPKSKIMHIVFESQSQFSEQTNRWLQSWVFIRAMNPEGKTITLVETLQVCPGSYPGIPLSAAAYEWDLIWARPALA